MDIIKETIINDSILYVKSKFSGTRLDVYYGRKAYENKKRGHYAEENGSECCNRQAPALEVFRIGTSLCLKISGSLSFPLN